MLPTSTLLISYRDHLVYVVLINVRYHRAGRGLKGVGPARKETAQLLTIPTAGGLF